MLPHDRQKAIRHPGGGWEGGVEGGGRGELPCYPVRVKREFGVQEVGEREL